MDVVTLGQARVQGDKRYARSYALPALRKLARGSENVNIAVLTDSTGQTQISGNTPRWPRLVCNAIAALFPAYTVIYHEWSSDGSQDQYDGTIYPSDEARMLAEMGDTTFSLGHLGETSWRDAMTSDTLLEPILASMTETAPMCSDCAAQPYCGADPVGHHATQGDFVGFKPTSAFCQKQLGVFSLLVRMLEDEPETAEVLRSWVR